jgi:hypothetical protein
VEITQLQLALTRARESVTTIESAIAARESAPKLRPAFKTASLQAREAANLLGKDSMFFPLRQALNSHALLLESASVGSKRLYGAALASHTTARSGVADNLERFIDDGMHSREVSRRMVTEIVGRPASTWTPRDRRILDTATNGKLDVFGLGTVVDEGDCHAVNKLVTSSKAADLERARSWFQDIDVRADIAAKAETKTLTPEESTARVRLLLSKGLEGLTKLDRQELSSLVHLDTPMRPVGLLEYDGHSLAWDIARKDNHGEYSDYTRHAIRRFIKAWTVDPNISQAQAAARYDELMSKTLEDMAFDDFAEIDMLIHDLPPSVRVTPVTRKIGEIELTQILNDIEVNRPAYEPLMQRFIAATKYAGSGHASKEYATQRAAKLLLRDTPNWTRAQRDELLTLLVDVPKELRAAKFEAATRNHLGDNLEKLFSSESDSVKGAARESMRRYVAGVRNSLDTTLTKERVEQHIRTLLDRPVDTWTNQDVAEFVAAAEDLPDSLRPDGPTKIHRFQLWDIGRYRKHDPRGETLMRRAARAWQIHLDPNTNAERSTARAQELLQRPLPWTDADREELAVLIYDLPERSRASLPGLLKDAEFMNAIAGLPMHPRHKQVEPSIEERLKFDAHMRRVQIGQAIASDPTMTLEKARARVMDIVGREPAEWSEDDYLTFIAIIHDLPEEIRPRGTTGIDEYESFTTFNGKFSPEREAWVDQRIDRLARTWRLTGGDGVTKEALTRRTRELFTSGLKNATDAEKSELFAIAVDAPDGLRADVPRPLNSSTLALVLEGADRSYEVETSERVARMLLDPSVTQATAVEQFDALMNRDAATWTLDDRYDLYALSYMPFTMGLGESLRVGNRRFDYRIADSFRQANTQLLDRGAAAWRFRRDGMTSSSAANEHVARLMLRPIADWTARERAEVLALLQDVPEEHRATPIRQVGGYSLVNVLEGADDADKLAAAGRRYDEIWAFERDPKNTPESVRHDILRRFATDPATWTDADRAHMRKLLFDLSPEMTPAGPRAGWQMSLSGALNAPQLDEDVIAALKHYASWWTKANDPALTREVTTQRIAELLGRDAQSWTEGERREIAMLLSDVPANVRPAGFSNDISGYAPLEVFVTRFDESVPQQIVRRYQEAAKLLASPHHTREANIKWVAGLIDRDIATANEQELRTLQAIACDIAEELRPPVAGSYGGTSIPTVISNPEIPRTDEQAFLLHRWAHQFRFSTSANPSRERAATRAHELLTLDPAAITNDIRAELAALVLDLPKGLRPAIPLAVGKLDLRTMLADPSKIDADAFRIYAVAMRANHDTGFRAERVQQIDDLLLGSQNPELSKEMQAGLWKDELLAESKRLLESTSGLDAAGIAARTLPSVPGNSVDAKVLYQKISKSLEVGVPPHLVELRDETRRIADVNALRIEGKTASGEVRGYSNYPEYADIGRITSNIEMMQALGGAEPSSIVSW